MQAFQKLCAEVGYRAIRVQVDDSEFPFLVYGVLAGRCEYGDLRAAFDVVPGYVYGACLMLPNPDDSYTVFALHMTPRQHYGQDRGTQLLVMQRLRQLAASQR